MWLVVCKEYDTTHCSFLFSPNRFIDFDFFVAIRLHLLYQFIILDFIHYNYSAWLFFVFIGSLWYSFDTWFSDFPCYLFGSTILSCCVVLVTPSQPLLVNPNAIWFFFKKKFSRLFRLFFRIRSCAWYQRIALFCCTWCGSSRGELCSTWLEDFWAGNFMSYWFILGL